MIFWINTLTTLNSKKIHGSREIFEKPKFTELPNQCTNIVKVQDYAITTEPIRLKLGTQLQSARS